MADSLFGHIALTFGAHPENLATEALAFILQRSPAANGVLRTLLEQLGAQALPASVTWCTQATADDGARPDLVALDGSGGQPVVMEAKFDAGLTDHQPVTYLDRPGLRALVVVAPAKRATYLWNELRRRCQVHGCPFVEAPDRPQETHSADVGNQRLLVLVSWRTLLGAMLARVEAEYDHRTARDIAQLQGLCERIDSEIFVPVRGDELTTTIFRRVVEFGQIVDDVTSRLVDAGDASTKGLRSTAGNGWYGRYLWLGSTGCLLMCDVRKWMRYEATPLWLSVYGPDWRSAQAAREALVPLANEQPARLFVANDGFPTVPLRVPTGVERYTVVDDIVSQVTRVARLLPSTKSAGAPLPPEAPDEVEVEP